MFGDMTIGARERTIGQLRVVSRVDRVETLPRPIRCGSTAHKATMVNGKRQIIVDSIVLPVDHVATTVDVEKRRYWAITQGGTPVPGIGDEVSIDAENRMNNRKGVLTIFMCVAGDMRDRALDDDTRMRLTELTRLVVSQMP